MSARLSWDADTGFTLDLDEDLDDVALSFEQMPVPADGLHRLRAAPVHLYALDLLFKSTVDLGESPGQLHGATVQLVDGPAIEIKGDLEDAETGQTAPWHVEIAVQIAGDPPEEGGPVPEEPMEEDLDWDDEDPEVAGVVAGGGERAGAGLDALLRALVTGADTSERASAPPELPDDEEPVEDEGTDEVEADGDEAGGLLDALLGLRTARDESAELADGFLAMLIERELLELGEDADRDALARGAAPILMAESAAEVKAARLSKWLMAQAAVEELYIGDEELEALLEQW